MENYLDFDTASTTKCHPQVGKCLLESAYVAYGNPSSRHALGTTASHKIRGSRRILGDLFGVPPEAVLFTSSGTEANNLVVLGSTLRRFAQTQSSRPETDVPGTGKLLTMGKLLVSAIEHPSVHRPAEYAQTFGAHLKTLPVDHNAQLIADGFKANLTSDVYLLSIQWVNPVVGAIQKISEIAREAKHALPRVIFHTDGVQGFGKLHLPQAQSGLDFISLSSHKVGGPKGAGALIALTSKGFDWAIQPLIQGGGQEQGLRAGTENPGLIQAFALAARSTCEKREESFKKVTSLKNLFRTCLAAELGEKIFWNSPVDALPYIVNLSVGDLPASTVAHLLESEGFLVSTGSACHSRLNTPEPTLVQMGFSSGRCRSAIRMSFSAEHTPAQIESLAQALLRCVNRVHRLAKWQS